MLKVGVYKNHAESKSTDLASDCEIWNSAYKTDLVTVTNAGKITHKKMKTEFTLSARDLKIFHRVKVNFCMASLNFD